MSLDVRSDVITTLDGNQNVTAFLRDVIRNLEEPGDLKSFNAH